MKTYNITEVEPLSPIGAGTVQLRIRVHNYRVPPVSFDDEGEPLYLEMTDEDIEKETWFRSYRINMVRHTKPESERKSVTDGAIQKTVESTFFDSRDPEQDQKAKQEALGLAFLCIMECKQ